MCDLIAAATGMAAASSLYSGVAQRQAANFNAKLSERQAEADRAQAASEADKKRRDIRRVLGSQRAQYAAAGVRGDTGTPAAVMADTAAEGERDVQTILRGGELRADEAENRARASRMQGRTGLVVGALGAGEEVGRGFIADKYLRD